VLYVDPSSTAPDTDPNTGSITTPFSTLEAAVERSRTLTKPLDIILRAGAYYLTNTIELGPKDSGLRIANYPNEEAIISGGIPLQPAWKDASAECGPGCFAAYLPNTTSIPGFRRDGVREIRARWPDFDEELDSVDKYGNYLVHDGNNGWAHSKDWVMNGTDINGFDVWPPVSPAKTHIVTADDWPGVEWPMQEMIVDKNGDLKIKPFS